MLKPADLPNVDGFEFIGITEDGEKKCRVVRDKSMAMYVDGEAKYYELIGWKRLGE